MYAVCVYAIKVTIHFKGKSRTPLPSQRGRLWGGAPAEIEFGAF